MSTFHQQQVPVYRPFPIARFLPVLMLVLLACTAMPVETREAVRSFSAKPAEMKAEDGVADGTTGKVFFTGFDHISRKYIQETEIPAMVLEGLRGLGSLDPAISIVEQSGFVTLRVENRDVITLPAPEPDDVDGWAHLATLVVLEARRQSSPMENTDIERIYETVFDGALSTLDVYSRYAGAVEATANRAKRDGYGGIGIRFKIRDGAVIVTGAVEGSPSAQAGIKPHDLVLSIDGAPVAAMKSHQIRAVLRGPVDTAVTLTIVNEQGKTVDHKLVRRHIIPATVTARREDNVLYLKVEKFNQDTARSFSNIIRASLDHEDAARPLAGMIIDLRGNPGGLLKQSIEVANTLLVNGHILDTLGRHPDSIQHYEAVGSDVARGRPLVILIDGRSASASEIVAAALQDQARAVVLGTSSYGKGTVQTVVRLPNEGEITLTWSRFMAPSGYALQGLGVFPAICTSSAAKNSQSLAREDLSADETARVMRSWRATPLQATGERRDLRSNCPPERHSGDRDIRLARTLIHNAALYSRALALSGDTLSGDQQIAAD